MLTAHRSNDDAGEVILPFTINPNIDPRTTAVGRQPEALWHPAEVPYVAAILSSVHMDLTTLSRHRAELAGKLAELTRQLAAIDTQINCLNEVGARLTRDVREGGAE